MAYEPKTWECGDVVSADALNHMEQGIADANELPSVTSADNGKVLGVDGGEYKLVEQSGGGESDVFVVTFTGSLSGNLSADKTFDEMEQAALSGKVVIGHYDGSGAGYSLATLYLSDMDTSKGNATASFTRSYAYANGSGLQASIGTMRWVKATGAITSKTVTITQ